MKRAQRLALGGGMVKDGTRPVLDTGVVSAYGIVTLSFVHEEARDGESTQVQRLDAGV